MRKEQFQRYLRYFRLYLRHATLKKIINLLRVEFKLAKNCPDLQGTFPYFLTVEISNACNLRCPLCQMGRREHIQRPNIMNADNYSKIITPLKDYLFQVILYDWGEPFLNRDIYKIIEINKELNIGTIVSSNLNTDIDAKLLVESGIDYLIISADGHTQEVYSSYRVNGDLSKVINNLRNIISEKKKQKSKYPFIEWQCLVTRYSEPYLSNIQELALQEGVNTVRFSNINFYSSKDIEADKEKWLPQNKAFRHFEQNFNHTKKKRKPCFWLWRTMVINTNGGVTPCCLFDTEDWGNVTHTSLVNLRNEGLFLEARKRSLNQPEKKNKLICDSCNAPFIFK